ncbi:MAG TPA: hypothetical protein VFZ65_16490 [Planctomycetota bacterium]|nr:hypothetical protein [Planctomycetota bacterium]
MSYHLPGAMFLLSLAVLAQDKTKNPALHVAFVGDLQSERGADFVGFLRSQFPRVDGVERSTCTPDQLRTADVVVLDWPQDQGVMLWQQDGQKPRQQPLGELSRWDRPTVLLGSAGLNLAAAWNLPGTNG